MKKTISLIIAIVMFALTVSGCSSSAAPTSSAAPAASADSAASAEPSASAEAPKFEFTKNVNLIIPYAAGSTADVWARQFAAYAEKIIGKTIICENKEGGSGVVGVNYMLAQPADGNTIVYCSGAIEYLIASNMAEGLDENAIEPIGNLNSDYNTICVPQDSQFNTLSEVIDYALEHPGELNWGGAQTLGTHHYLCLRIQQLTGMKVNYITYDSATATASAMLGGNLDVASYNAGTSKPYRESGDFKILAGTLTSGDPILTKWILCLMRGTGLINLALLRFPRNI